MPYNAAAIEALVAIADHGTFDAAARALHVTPSAVSQRIHVIGRTRTIPHQYYYRCQIDKKRWTAWDRVSADIEGDSVLMERYGTRVPVVLLDEVEHFAGNVTEGELRRAIKKARWRRPISRILFRLGYAPRQG